MTQVELMQFAAERLERFHIPYAIVGSYASGIWGEPRMTRDIDFVVQLDPNVVESFCAAFPEDDYYVSVAAAKEAVRRCSQFNVICIRDGFKFDFMVVPRTGWAARQLARRQSFDAPTGEIRFAASPEDVILGKLIYYQEGQSDKHLRDIAGIIKACKQPIDFEYLETSARELAVVDEWKMALKKAGLA